EGVETGRGGGGCQVDVGRVVLRKLGGDLVVAIQAIARLEDRVRPVNGHLADLVRAGRAGRIRGQRRHRNAARLGGGGKRGGEINVSPFGGGGIRINARGRPGPGPAVTGGFSEGSLEDGPVENVLGGMLGNRAVNRPSR